MRKAMITKAIVGSLVRFTRAVVLFLVSCGLALWDDSLIMNRPDVSDQTRPIRMGDDRAGGKIMSG
jgi:hypothetical protein